MSDLVTAIANASDLVREAMAITRRGAEQLLPEADWLKKLQRSEATGVPLRIKFGMDPTAPDLHLGHTVVLNKMRQLQDLGHVVIPLIGDFTTTIGDPSGRNSTRPPLTRDQIEANARTYFEQVGLVIDMARAEVRWNSEWSDPLGARGMIRLAAKYTVARMMEREDFATRFRDGTPISVHEFLYPLMQGFDSVALKADLELGGTDQTFNLLIGPPPAAGRRPGAAVHPDHAPARGPGRRGQDVQEQGQLCRHHRAGADDVRQGAVDQ
jgi:tyrosyl-tRNA synthetase